MEKRIEETTKAFVDDYSRKHGVKDMWRPPSVKYADAANPGFAQLKQVVTRGHYLPADILSGAKSVVSYFIPFTEQISEDNIKGRVASASWARTYLVTSAMTSELSSHLVTFIRDQGFKATLPQSGSDWSGRSYWSQRHVARLAGHGTFGVNNMLITEFGCCGRFYSVVTNVSLETDDVVPGENCLHKRGEECGVCAKRCVGDALTTKSFDVGRCAQVCAQTARVHAWADVCGKCLVGVPCSLQRPEPVPPLPS